MNLSEEKERALSEIQRAKDLKALNNLFKKYLGKKGQIAQVFGSFKNLPGEEKIKIGREANQAKNSLIKAIGKKRASLSKVAGDKREWIDITVPGEKLAVGHLHPLTLVKRDIEEIFQRMGFSVISGPEIETEFYNFDALNIPADHPARDLWDTFYLENKLLLRTHTSPVQIRFMEKNNPPFQIIVPGRIFRHEATDASHEINFYQVEGLMVGKEVSVANFRAVIQEFFSRFFGKPVKIRLRPSFFPFVEPGFEIDMSCLVCGGKGCSTCSKTGWVEIMGAGMVNPNVLKAGGINPKNWQGFAFGVGMDRLAMMKYKINDVRLFYSGDLRFLNQF